MRSITQRIFKWDNRQVGISYRGENGAGVLISRRESRKPDPRRLRFCHPI